LGSEGTFVRFRTKVFLYVALVVSCILANYLLWRYRMHLYNLDTDYEREPLHDDQMILFGASLAITAGGALLLLVEVVRSRVRAIRKSRP
jgi:hypothetical protein